MTVCDYCSKPVPIVIYHTTPNIRELRDLYRSPTPETYCDAECSTLRYEALQVDAVATPSRE